ncbi:DUF349 domain-containing protein [Demequina aurantiaca]|uniref:DUF349 domain-containing protein n=1 Tax=Demequina aurantiaca TaxID=676200 RepID=UPI0007806F9D|nr:DUF349 domain-containing protein [Demequina aurantiaca]
MTPSNTPPSDSAEHENAPDVAASEAIDSATEAATAAAPEPANEAVAPAAESAKPTADAVTADEAAATTDDVKPATEVAKSSAKTAPKPTAKPRPAAPKPGSFAQASPANVAAHKTHPVKVPVVHPVTPEELAAAKKHAEVVDDKVFVIDGETKHEVGEAKGDEPISPYVRAYSELQASIERFHARLSSAELSPKDIDDSMKSITSGLETPVVVGDLAALRERFAVVEAEATEVRSRIQAERKAAREAAIAVREEIVVKAEAIAAKDVATVHWKNDTTTLRDLLDSWKEAQRSGARVPKDTERALWKRFTHARSAFEKARKHHFAELDKENGAVASAKEALVAKAQTLAESTDWDRTARAFKDLMGEWKNSGRGRRSTDDALWKKFQKAQDAFFDARRSASDAEDEALAGNVEAKEAAVVEAEALLPIKDLELTKKALHTAQDRFEAAGQVPRGDIARLTKRMSAVEKAVRDAEESAWTSRNPELEARATGAAAQLQAAISKLEAELAEAKAAKDTKAVKSLTEDLTARTAWLKQIEGLS